MDGASTIHRAAKSLFQVASLGGNAVVRPQEVQVDAVLNVSEQSSLPERVTVQASEYQNRNKADVAELRALDSDQPHRRTGT